MKKIQRVNVPYKTTTGVEIGIRYQQPKPMMSRDEELIQAALLGHGKVTNLSPWMIISCVFLCYLLVSCMGVWR